MPLDAREVWPQNKIIKGIPASPGIIIGPAYVIANKNKVHISQTYLISFQQVTREIERFRDAVLQTRQEITTIKNSITDEFHGSCLYFGYASAHPAG